MSVWIDVAEESSLQVGHCRTVEVGGLRLALARLPVGFYAVADACPHRGGALGAGCLDGTKLRCPLHGWGFDVQTGACDERPEKPVRTYLTRVEDGRVWVQCDGSINSI